MDYAFDWDFKELAPALKINESDVRPNFTDGRRASFILERRIAIEFINGKVAESEGAPYDVIDSEGKKWEVRCITKDGVKFPPSSMIGKG